MSNTCLILSGHHESNIPTVSFCNTLEDREGNYLISADIQGLLCVWNLKNFVIDHIFKPKPDAQTMLNPWNQMGWAVHWLDPRAFRKCEGMGAFLPGSCILDTPPSEEQRSVIMLPAATEAITHTWRFQRSRANARESFLTFDNMTDTGHKAGPGLGANFGSDELLSTEDPTVRERAIERRGKGRYVWRGGKLHPLESKYFEDSSGNGTFCYDFGNAPKFDWPSLWPRRNIFSLKDADTNITAGPPSCPLLYLRPSFWSLFQSPKFGLMTRDHPYTVLMEPLEQKVYGLDMRRQLHRPNLTFQIPELGIVLVGSPIGRVAVLTLNKLTSNPFSSTAIKPLYTMRLDRVLPFPMQEKLGERPPQSLVGISAGPVQGSLNNEGSENVDVTRRWRVSLL